VRVGWSKKLKALKQLLNRSKTKVRHRALNKHLLGKHTLLKAAPVFKKPLTKPLVKLTIFLLIFSLVWSGLLLFNSSLKNKGRLSAGTLISGGGDYLIDQINRVWIKDENTGSYKPYIKQDFWSKESKWVTLQDNSDLVVKDEGTVVAIDGRHTLNSLTVQDNAVVTHSPVSELGRTDTDHFAVFWEGWIRTPKREELPGLAKKDPTFPKNVDKFYFDYVGIVAEGNNSFWMDYTRYNGWKKRNDHSKGCKTDYGKTATGRWKVDENSPGDFGTGTHMGGYDNYGKFFHVRIGLVEKLGVANLKLSFLLEATRIQSYPPESVYSWVPIPSEYLYPESAVDVSDCTARVLDNNAHGLDAKFYLPYYVQYDKDPLREFDEIFDNNSSLIQPVYGEVVLDKPGDSFKYDWGFGSPFGTIAGGAYRNIGGLRLEIAGDLTLKDGGRIDVSYRGYPGGFKPDAFGDAGRDWIGYGIGGAPSYKLMNYTTGEPTESRTNMYLVEVVLSCSSGDDVGGGGGGFASQGALSPHGPSSGHFTTAGGYPIFWRGADDRIYLAGNISRQNPQFASPREGKKDIPLLKDDGDLNFEQLSTVEADLSGEWPNGDSGRNKVAALFGSGGAGGIHSYCVGWDQHYRYFQGGRGGGLVYLKVGGAVSITETLTRLPIHSGIYANGEGQGDANKYGDDGYYQDAFSAWFGRYSGSGSGGLIYIKADFWNNGITGEPDVSSGCVANVDVDIEQSCWSADGQTYNVITDARALSDYGSNIQAKGGAGKVGAGFDGGGSFLPKVSKGDGGGGVIVINAPQASIKKTIQTPNGFIPFDKQNFMITSTVSRPAGGGLTETYEIVDTLPNELKLDGTCQSVGAKKCDGKTITWERTVSGGSGSEGGSPIILIINFATKPDLSAFKCGQDIINHVELRKNGQVLAKFDLPIKIECKLYFNGDVYAEQTNFSKKPEGTGAVGVKKVKPESPVFGTQYFPNYTLTEGVAWNDVQKNVKKLVSDKLKKYARECPADNSNTINLNTLTLPESKIPPEGLVYYCDKGTPGRPRDSVTLYGALSSNSPRITFIFDNIDVNINSDITVAENASNPAKNPTLGVVVINKNINIANSVNEIEGAFFTEQQVKFNGFQEAQMPVFKGLIIASQVKLPPTGSFNYDSRISKYPPPGFKEILKALYHEVAP